VSIKGVLVSSFCGIGLFSAVGQLKLPLSQLEFPKEPWQYLVSFVKTYLASCKLLFGSSPVLISNEFFSTEAIVIIKTLSKPNISNFFKCSFGDSALFLSLSNKSFKSLCLYVCFIFPSFGSEVCNCFFKTSYRLKSSGKGLISLF